MNNCKYKYIDSLPPCINFKTPKYSYLNDFLENKSTRTQKNMITHSINCIKKVDGGIEIKETNCISCMLCLFNCPGNLIQLKDNLNLIAKCDSYGQDVNLHNSSLQLFNGELIELPKILTLNPAIKYKKFEDFTAVDETKNISIWGAGILRFLMSEQNPRLALEVGMQIKNRDRGGRLDIVAMSQNQIFVAEAKVSFQKMIDEQRYLAQMLAYEDELSEAIPSHNTTINFHKFLLIGGNESDLLPPAHLECTSNTGNQAATFYKNIDEHEIFFISANALLCLGLLKIMSGNKLSLDYLSEKIFVKNAVGLLSNGLIVKTGDTFKIVDLIN
ncbi:MULTISPECIES: hypothetical protein [unclassified Marinobacterium]|uniref:hypothetical protein n=1 Tax=unclassified Marinobacterium TaxID=2644139 RepID=UPI001568CDFE|nr:MULTISPECIES: hypothetical protein [unclassified Marinobacterium]NRP52358.1 hypothetical protein [Marinobacterium sp. xm-v-242]NRP76939.1 hypothetical protein [Marinobacterium sp. xm-m-383]